MQQVAVQSTVLTTSAQHPISLLSELPCVSTKEVLCGWHFTLLCNTIPEKNLTTLLLWHMFVLVGRLLRHFCGNSSVGGADDSETSGSVSKSSLLTGSNTINVVDDKEIIL